LRLADVGAHIAVRAVWASEGGEDERMNLNPVSLPATNVARPAEFYRSLGFLQIVSGIPAYARFECPGGTTFSLHQVASVAEDSAVVPISSEASGRDLQSPGRT
jgi:hypothetical protein